jgi:hypothetical protein
VLSMVANSHAPLTISINASTIVPLVFSMANGRGGWRLSQGGANCNSARSADPSPPRVRCAIRSVLCSPIQR